MFLLSNNHLWSSSFKKYHHFSVFSVFIFSLFLTYRAIFQLLGSEEKSHINNLFLYWPQLTSLTVWILTCPGYVNLLRDGLLMLIHRRGCQITCILCIHKNVLNSHFISYFGFFIHPKKTKNNTAKGTILAAWCNYVK